MDKDYLLIAVDPDRKFAIRFLSLEHAARESLALKKLPASLEAPYLELLLSGVLLGSRVDDQESKLFKLHLSPLNLRLNCEVNPRGPFRSAVFPREGAKDFAGPLAGELHVTVLNQKNETYTSSIELNAAGLTQTFRDYLEMSVQSQSLFFTNPDPSNPAKNFSLWIEKLPGTSHEEWHAVWERFADGKLFQESFQKDNDPDRIMAALFDRPPQILAVTKPSLFCPCNLEAFKKALELLPKEDLLELFMEGKGIESQCDYCGKTWRVDDESVRDMLGIKPVMH